MSRTITGSNLVEARAPFLPQIRSEVSLSATYTYTHVSKGETVDQSICVAVSYKYTLWLEFSVSIFI